LGRTEELLGEMGIGYDPNTHEDGKDQRQKAQPN
jgi:hypothetical protein